MNLSFLPLTWIEGNTIFFEWTTDIPSVQISLEDETGTIINEEVYVANTGCTSTMNIDNLDEGSIYTLHLYINGQTYIATFSL